MVRTKLVGPMDGSALKAALVAALQNTCTTHHLDVGSMLGVGNVELLNISGGASGSTLSFDFTGLTDAQSNALIALLQTNDASIAALVNQQLQKTSAGSALVADATTHLYFVTSSVCVFLFFPFPFLLPFPACFFFVSFAFLFGAVGIASFIAGLPRQYHRPMPYVCISDGAGAPNRSEGRATQRPCGRPSPSGIFLSYQPIFLRKTSWVLYIYCILTGTSGVVTEHYRRCGSNDWEGEGVLVRLHC